MKKIYLISLLFLIAACNSSESHNKTTGHKLNVVTTTSLLTEMISQIGGDALEVQGLMGAGVDPHLYKPGEGDVNLLYNADVIFYTGLHLEGKMQDVLEKMQHKGIVVIAVSDTLNRDSLIQSANFASNYDPHIWFDISNWKLAAAYAAKQLSARDTVNRQIYMTNAAKYIANLDTVEHAIRHTISELPREKRILITAHDAFNYFGRAYNFEVLGLQGISTASEAGVQDVQNLAALIAERKVKAIFVETSVPSRNIEALKEAVESRGYHVEIGGSLYSDALGNPGTPEGTYGGMFLHNVNVIVHALKKE